MDDDHSRIRLNYIYFGFFLFLLLIISASMIFVKDSLSESKIFFFLYAGGQALLEIALLLLCGFLIQKVFGKTGFSIFIGFTFILFILHIFDFLMERILDLSIWETVGFVLDENWTNFIYLLDASGIPFWIWGVMFSFLAMLPFLGILFYHFSAKLSRNKPLFFKKEWLFQIFICLPIGLIFWEYSVSHWIHPNSYTGFVKSLPWKFTFLQPKHVAFSLPHPLKEAPKEESFRIAIEKESTQLSSKPNIYLFVVESFREDFITQEIAPHLTQFKEESNHFQLALSNGNGTHLSWFSIFHSQFPHYWKELKNSGWQMGSPPIQLLKKWGYQVRLYSSAELNYYGMEHLLFGENHHLVDSFNIFHHSSPICACDADALALDALQQDLKDPALQEGQLIIVFWDSTHFNYSWPKITPFKFSPVATDASYFQLFHSADTVERIKNRYRNAVFYIDSLFEKFMKTLPKKEEAIVVVTGDHGEEFLEHGHLFHCSHLVHEQTNIPLYMKFGKKKCPTTTQFVSQIDIFPSIIHYLSEKESSLFEGQSIFNQNRWPFVFMARFNAGRHPYEFCIHNGKNKFIAQFANKKNIFQSKQLKIRSLCDQKDSHLCKSTEHIQEWIQTEFGEALHRLYSNPVTP